MELRYLRYFVTVAERQNFTHAAKELNVAQPAVSQQIKTLEDELGVPLLLRTKRSVKLTAGGHAFLREAKEILAHAEQSKQVARRAARGEIGSLSIGCFGSSVSSFLPKLIRTYRERFPAVRIHLFEMTPEQQLQAFDREKIDVGFTRSLPASHKGAFEVECIYRDRLMIVLPEGHPFAKNKSVRLDKCADLEFVMFRRIEAPKQVDQTIQLCRTAGFTPNVVSEPPMMQTVLLSVAAGVGVSLVPGCVQSLGQKGVVFRTITPGSQAIHLIMVRKRGDGSPTVAAWTELVREHLPDIRLRMEKGISQTSSLATNAKQGDGDD